MTGHINLFAQGHASDEVYDSIASNQTRDFRRVHFWDLAFFTLAVGAVINFQGLRPALILGAAYAAIMSLRYFIDLTCRNYFLHRLDWDRAVSFEKERGD